MLAGYVGVLVILCVGTLLIGALLCARLWLAPSARRTDAQAPEAVAERRVVGAREPHASRFFRVAALLIVFEVAAVLAFAWSAAFGALGWFGYAAFVVFGIPLLVGGVYAAYKGGFEW